MAGFSLYVSNTTSTKQGYLCYKDHTTGTPSLDQNISCSIYGRYVIYYNERSHNRPSYLSQYAYNELCELQVFGEYILIFIFFLFLSSNSCSSFFFVFFHFIFWIGCRGNYGDGCLYACPRNCLNGNCDAFTGHCLNCSSGYYGPLCINGLYLQNYCLSFLMLHILTAALFLLSDK